MNVRVLVADDTEDVQRLVATLLRRAGFEIDVARNGRVAVEMAVAAGERGAPYDLVLMDMQMPELDGYAAARELRARGCRLPIIALTANAVAGDRERCLEVGCTDFVAKPIDGLELVACVQAYLGESPTAAPIRRELDLDEGTAALANGFVDRLGDRIRALRVAHEAKDVSSMLRLAHQLRGSSGSFGFPALSAACESLENELEREAHSPDAARLLGIVERVAARIVRGR